MKKYYRFLLVALVLFFGTNVVGYAQEIEDSSAAVEVLAPAPKGVYNDDEDNEDNDEFENEGNRQLKLKEEKALIKEGKKEIGSGFERKMNDSNWKKITSDDKFNYEIKKIEKPAEIKPRSTWRPRISENTGVVLLYVLFAIALALILYAIFGAQYISKRDKSIGEEVAIDYEDVEYFTEWELALKAAESEKNYRKAIRILYNQTLQKLTNQQLIKYRKEATNQMYVNALNNTPYYQCFSDQTRIFNYVWYGEYGINESQYLSAKNDFNLLINQIG
jgi:hypothetical protein